MGGARDMIHSLVAGLLIGQDPRGVLGHWNVMVDHVFKSGNRGCAVDGPSSRFGWGRRSGAGMYLVGPDNAR